MTNERVSALAVLIRESEEKYEEMIAVRQDSRPVSVHAHAAAASGGGYEEYILRVAAGMWRSGIYTSRPTHWASSDHEREIIAGAKRLIKALQEYRSLFSPFI